jgi:hypothetical protein
MTAHHHETNIQSAALILSAARTYGNQKLSGSQNLRASSHSTHHFYNLVNIENSETVQ